MRPNATLYWGLIAAALAATAVACAPEEEAPPPPPEVECDEGLIQLEDGSCVVPEANCGDGVPGSILAECAAKSRTCFDDGRGDPLCGICLDGFVEDGGACRPVEACDDLRCEAEGRVCVDGEGLVDARCGACLPGTDPMADRCVVRTCSLDAIEGSIAGTCASQSRRCEDGPVEAGCGECYPGFTEQRGLCRPVRTCEELGCREANRSCAPQQIHGDASCGSCRAGFEERGGRCFPIRGATCDVVGEKSILAACEAELRGCETGNDGASCGDCQAGHVPDPVTNTCVPFVGCDELSCADENRRCEEKPLGTCTRCLDGHAEDASTGRCRPVRSCAQLACGTDQQCREATTNADAFCHPACPAGESWAGNRCTPCPPCDGEGEDGVWDEISGAGSCICRTKPGYFFSTAGDVGTFPCDADGDGWVRESARLAIESPDRALHANARCELLTIDRILLINEAGQQREQLLNEPLALYETDRNDDQAILAVHWSSKGLPGYRQDGSRVPARELNRFTKLCHDPRTDYNDNGIPDVSEWSGHVRGPAMRPEQTPFNEFSYFAELARGHYEPAGPGRSHGRWVIREKSREVAEPGEELKHLAMGYAPDAGSYWRQCEVWRDPRFGKVAAPVGMDFARFSDRESETFSGMNLHSQFKCIVLQDDPKAGAVQEMTPAGAAANGFALNRCRGVVDGEERTETSIACSLVGAGTLRPGDVLWGAVPYRDYGPTPFNHVGDGDPGAGYQGGCINACSRALFEDEQCSGFQQTNPVAVACNRDARDSGRFLSCDTWEVCDGKDNTGEGQIDEGNPGGGFDCEVPGQTGICLAGTTNCRGGRIVCDQNEGPFVEQCNGLDNNCDGKIDRTFPTDGQACKVDGLKGRCADGLQTCTLLEDEGGNVTGGRTWCRQQYMPEEERCGDNVDWDCDGSPSTKNGSIEGLQGCVNYYRDADKDGFPDRNYPPRCLCGSDGTYTVREPADGPPAIKWDCCDSDARANPNATSYYTTKNACGSFDYNCNSREEQQYTYQAKSCEKKGTVFECHLPGGEGWDGAPPDCGISRSIAYNCRYNSGTTGCHRDTRSRTQACR